MSCEGVCRAHIKVLANWWSYLHVWHAEFSFFFDPVDITRIDEKDIYTSTFSVNFLLTIYIVCAPYRERGGRMIDINVNFFLKSLKAHPLFGYFKKKVCLRRVACRQYKVLICVSMVRLWQLYRLTGRYIL